MLIMEVGLRVVRGPDWKWENQDDGEGHVGTVVEIGRRGSPSTPEDTVVVQWDTGNRTNYRTGFNEKYDLRVLDSAPIGVRHPNVTCDACLKHGIAGIRWKCAICTNVDLCSYCYHNDKHDLSHSFLRFDHVSSVGQSVSKRSSKSSIKITAKGIFVGARVARGYDWDWGNQDGGDGKVGKVIDIRGWDNESRRSVANVMWSSGSTNVYRLGHKGKVDLKCIQAAEGGKYYRDHLPILGVATGTSATPGPATTSPNSNDVILSAADSSTNGTTTSITNSPARQTVTASSSSVVVDGAVCSTQSTPSTSTASSQPAIPHDLQVGDKVKVIIEEEATLKTLQEGHGGWNPRMARFLGKVGTVHRMTEHGDVRVKFPDSQLRWTFNPVALVHLYNFQVGDIVKVIEDSNRVKLLQVNHGEWIEQMRQALGQKGKIVKVYLDNDLRVQMDSGTTWTFNPLCVTFVSSSPQVTHSASEELTVTPQTSGPVNEVIEGQESTNALSRVGPPPISILQGQPQFQQQSIQPDVYSMTEFVRDMGITDQQLTSSGGRGINGQRATSRDKTSKTSSSGTGSKGHQHLHPHQQTSSSGGQVVTSTSGGNGDSTETIEKLKYLESKISEIEEAFSCSICMERVKNVVFLCGHSACVVCAQNLVQCHMCREPITRRINIY